MNHFIAMNPQRGGNKGSASCLPLAEYDKLIAQPWLHDMAVSYTHLYLSLTF